MIIHLTIQMKASKMLKINVKKNQKNKAYLNDSLTTKLKPILTSVTYV